MTITSVLCGLNIVSHLLAQILNLLRPSFKTLSNSAKSEEKKCRLQIVLLFQSDHLEYDL